MNYKLIGYAADFVSFLFEKLGKTAERIDEVILFGSIARGEADKNSDIDLFIDTDEKLEDQLNELRDDFYDSIKVKKYWNLFNINNKINLSIGDLKNWGDLQRSIIANGIILYGRYQGKPETQQYYLFILSLGADRNKNVSFWRKLYGYKQKIRKKEYVQEGMIKEYSGKKVARAVFLIPVENAHKLILFLRKNKINFQVIPIWVDKKGGL